MVQLLYRSILVVWLCLSLVRVSAHSENVYRWTDPKGNTHFTTRYERVPKEYRSQGKPRRARVDQKKEKIARKAPKVETRSPPSPPRMDTQAMDLNMMVTSRPDCKNEPAGFGGIKWGTDISRINRAGFYDGGITLDEVTFYRRKGNVLGIGPARVQRVYYGFWRGRFYGVLISVKGFDNFVHLKQICFETFGKGYKPEVSMERYTWGGETTGILIEYNDFIREGRLSIVSTRLAREIEEQKKFEEQGNSSTEGGLAKGLEKLQDALGRFIK